MKRDPANREPAPASPRPVADPALARRLREQTQANRDAVVVAEGQRRRRQRRLVRYLVVIVFALAIGGTLLERRWRAHAPAAPPPVPLAWDPVPALGEPATAPTGCREVTDRGLAPLEGLAEGSLVARDTQFRVAAELRRPLEVENTIGMRFRLIPPGSFVMGSPLTEAGRGPDEPPVVRMIEHPFYLGVTEVTQGQWERVMGADANPSYFRTAAVQRPVEEITWHEANLFAAKLATLEQVPAWTYRLPTEAEWEYACRAGTTTRYCFGDDERRLPEFAVYTVNRETGTEPVAQRRANAWGLFDLHGNVWEWCQDPFAYYDKPEIVDTLRRVIRGGNWRTKGDDCRSASRFRLPPDSRSNLLGMRLVRALVPPPAPPPPRPAPRALPQSTPVTPTEAPAAP